MPSNFLNIESFTSEELKDMIFSNPEYKKAMKLFAAYLVTQKWSARKISDLLGVSFKQITVWVHAINEEGIEGLDDKPKTGRKAQLTEQQKSELKNIILNKLPKDYNIKGERWKGDTVRELILALYKIDYKPSHIYNIINSLKLKYIKGKWQSLNL